MVQASQALRASGLVWESGKDDKSRNYIICFMFGDSLFSCWLNSDLGRTQRTQEAQLGQAMLSSGPREPGLRDSPGRDWEVAPPRTLRATLNLCFTVGN